MQELNNNDRGLVENVKDRSMDAMTLEPRPRLPVIMPLCDFLTTAPECTLNARLQEIVRENCYFVNFFVEQYLGPITYAGQTLAIYGM